MPLSEGFKGFRDVSGVLSMCVSVCDIITTTLLWKHCVSSLTDSFSPAGENKWVPCKWTHTSTVQAFIGETRAVNNFSSELNLTPRTGTDLYGYNKDKVTYKVNFDAADILIGVWLLIICKVPLKEALSQPLASNVTLSTHTWLMRWNKDPPAIEAASLLTGRKRDGSDNCVILLLLAALRYNKNKPSGIVLFLREHGNHSYRGLAICQEL